MLHLSGVDCVMLVRDREIIFQGGASIGFHPNALQIFYQLGTYKDPAPLTRNLGDITCLQHDNGRSFASTATLSEPSRHLGYLTLFFEREEVLQVLYVNLPGKSKILCSCEVQQSQLCNSCDQGWRAIHRGYHSNGRHGS